MTHRPPIPVPPELRDAETTLDHLAGDWSIYQLRHGHRFSNDDLLTAWVAARAAPAAERVLDLGAGIGAVGLLTLWRLGRPTVRLVSVEIQEVSWTLARRTVRHNRLTERVEQRLGDLRDPELVPAGERYDLITASPPYLPLAAGVASPHPQKAAARLELNGDLVDYCETAARVLDPDGVYCFCHAADDPRPEEAIAAVGLTLRARQEVRFRAHQPPRIAIFTCGHGGARHDPPPFCNRGADGRWTPGYLEMRRDMGTVVWNPEAP